MGIEPVHNKTNKMACAPTELRSTWASAQSDQSLLSPWKKLRFLATHWVHSKDSDQTGQMLRLIWVFAGHTCILLVLTCTGSISMKQSNRKLQNLFHFSKMVENLSSVPHPLKSWCIYLSPFRQADQTTHICASSVNPDETTHQDIHYLWLCFFYFGLKSLSASVGMSKVKDRRV